MKRLLKMLIILCFFYMLLQLAFKYFGTGHTVNYDIKGNNYIVKVKEEAKLNQKKKPDYYNFIFSVNQLEFPVQTYQTFKKNDYVVKDVKYLKTNSYECIYPIFKEKEQVTDILCRSYSMIYHYHDLKGKNSELDKFALEMKQYGYDETNWINSEEEKKESGPITIYPKNIVKNHYIGVDSYPGIYLINNYLEGKYFYDINLFSTDQYEKTLDGRAGQYYVTADYSSQYQFKQFYIVDLVYNDKKTVTYHDPISFNSYVQGSVDNAIYLFDRDNKKQYKIDAKAKTVVEIGNEKTGIKYYSLGKWETRKAVEAVTKNLHFNDYQIEETHGYDRVDQVYDVSYYYKKVGQKYEVYRSFDSKLKEYLFTTNNINEIQYLRDYVYFKEGNMVKYYHDMTGVRTVLTDSEFQFNKTLQYYTYYKK